MLSRTVPLCTRAAALARPATAPLHLALGQEGFQQSVTVFAAVCKPVCRGRVSMKSVVSTWPESGLGRLSSWARPASLEAGERSERRGKPLLRLLPCWWKPEGELKPLRDLDLLGLRG